MPQTSLARVLDPIGLTSASRKAGGGLKSAWDPLGVVMKKPSTSGTGTATAASPAVAASAPVTAADQLVLNTEQDMRRAALKKKGFSASIFAGDTGGFFTKNPNPAPATGPNLPGAKRLGGG